MQFIGPFNTETGLPNGPEVPWQNASPAFGVPGSVPSAEFYDHLQREICTVIDEYLGDGSFGSGQNGADLAQLYKAFKVVEARFEGGVDAAMQFTATVNPDDANPTNVNGGVFNTIRELVDAAPHGSEVIANLLPGRTHPLDVGTTVLANKSVTLNKSGAGANPTVAPVAFFDAGTDTNRFHHIIIKTGALIANEIDFALPAKVDPTKAWARLALVEYTTGFNRVTLQNGAFTGQDGQSVCSAHVGSIVQLSLRDMTLDGPIYAVSNGVSGAAIVAQYTTTLLNGAELFDSGVRGENLLHN